MKTRTVKAEALAQGPSPSPDNLPAAIVPTAVRSVAVEVPLCDPLASAYMPRLLQIALRGETQKRIVQQIRRGLIGGGHRLANGQSVQSNADAIRWLLETIASKCSA